MIIKNRSINEPVKYVTSIIILLVSGSAMYALYKSKSPPEDKQTVELAPTVSTATIEKFEGKLGLEISGLVVPFREIKLAAEVAGRIESKSELCCAGSFVSAGTPLLTIEQKDYELEFDRLNAELKQANVMIAELDDEIAGVNRSIELANDDWELQKKEYKRKYEARGALSDSEINEAKRSLNAAERMATELNNSLSLFTTRKSRLESGRKLSEIALEQAKLNLKRTEIVAPYDGVVVTDVVEQGDYVQKGEEVVTFEDTSKAEIAFNLRTDQLDQILKYHGSDELVDSGRNAYELPPIEVRVVSHGIGGPVSWEGRLSGYDGIGVDEETKTIPCRVVVDDPIAQSAVGPKALVRGMFVKVEIDLDPSSLSTTTNLITFPGVAVQPGNFIWTVGNNQILAHHKVEIVDRQTIASSGSSDEGSVLDKIVVAISLDGDVKPGDHVVVSPLARPNTDIEKNDEDIEVNVLEHHDPRIGDSPPKPDLKKSRPVKPEEATKMTSIGEDSRS